MVQDDSNLVYAAAAHAPARQGFGLRASSHGETQTVCERNGISTGSRGYDFAKPIDMPKGTRMIGISHFDNSAENRFNPDPTKEIRWGPQNWDEMSNCFIGLTMDLNDNPSKMFIRSRVQSS